MNRVNPWGVMVAVLLIGALAMRIMPAAAQEGLALPAPAIDIPPED